MTDLSLAPKAKEVLQQVCEVDYRPSSRDDLLKIIGDYDAFWGHVELQIDKEVLRRASRLQVVLSASTGTNHIDKEELARRGIRLLSITRDYGLLDTFSATAECAWMLLLACHRHFHASTASVFKGCWNGEAFRGRQLLDRTLGVLGVGRLGRMVVEMGKGFRMRVLGCDRVPFAIDGVEPVDFDTLLRKSDVISIHIHMDPENHHLFNDETFSRMKPDSILVNTSRGDIIDETALLAALESGRLAAFGADVVSNEWRDDMRESPLVQYAMTHDNVAITPHLGGCTYRSLADARVFAARKLVHYLKTGEELRMDRELST